MLFRLAPFAGLNKDLAAADLPVGAVTDSSNVRFREGRAELFLGQADAYGTAPVSPISAFPVRVGGARYWIVLSQTKAYCVTGSPAVWTNITRQAGGMDQDYAANLDTCWNGGILNGVPILNNGFNVPQMWSPVGAGTYLQALSNWPNTVTARVLRPFGNFMFAFDVTKSGTRYPYRVKWSHPADPGTVPVSWDETDGTKDAGEFDLAGPDFIVDALPLRQSLIVYKEGSTWIANQTGGEYKFGFQQLFSGSGMLSADCAVEVEGSHVVLTSSDVIRHDGSSMRSVLDKATRRWLFQNIDAAQYQRCFVTRNHYFNEVWICFPEVGQTRCTKALVYNHRDNTVSFRDLPNVTSANTGLVDDTAADSFDGGEGLPFDADGLPFDANEFGAQLERTMLCSPDRTSLILADSGPTFFVSPVPGMLERLGLAFDAPNQVKTVTRVLPRVNAPDGTVLVFRIGGQMTANGPVDWSDPVTFTVGVDQTVDAFASGRFLAYRVESSSAYGWSLEGLDFEATPRGSW